jgi:hypothetical protein
MMALDAASLVGLLADDHRRRCFAAIELGHGSLDAVAAATGLSSAQAGKALGKLAEAGLVVTAAGRLAVADGVFQAAAREALRRAPSTEHADLPAEQQKVLNAFVREGRLVSIPTAAGKRAVVLDWLAQEFEPGKRYTEAMVNLMLGQRHPDTAALRRYLVDGEFLSRESGIYWRSGGTVEP